MTQQPSRTAALLLAAGALAWLPTRWGVMTTWDSTWLGLDYAAWNRLSLVPLALLAVGSAVGARTAATRSASVGWAVLTGGFVLALAGVALEFVVGGGLQGGPDDIAVAGWTTYLLGLAVIAAGSLVLAGALARRDRPAAAAAAFVGLALLVWPVLLATGQEVFAVADQLAVALGWLVLAGRPAESADDYGRQPGSRPVSPSSR